MPEILRRRQPEHDDLGAEKVVCRGCEGNIWELFQTVLKRKKKVQCTEL